MKPYVADVDFTLYQGDCVEVLRGLPSESVHCCVTSPPYWGLRDYGHDGQIGLEQTPDEYVARMVEVFREVRRVLRDDGTLWLNLGDTYNSRLDASHGGWNGSSEKPQVVDERGPTNSWSGQIRTLAPKNLVGIPWRVALALQADGWILRCDIIWAKPNPMPESVTDRPTKAHEYVFLLTKSPRYYFDQDAVREDFTYDGRKVLTRENGEGTHPQHRNGKRDRWPGLVAGPAEGAMTLEGEPAPAVDLNANRRSYPAGQTGGNTLEGHTPGGSGGMPLNAAGRNVRSVWEIATQPYADAHFATFPQELPRRCIKAGTSERGCCPECGAPWEREMERTAMVISRSERTHEKGRTRSSGTMVEPPTTATTGWAPTCVHVHEPVQATVLDPFMGSGTTALVARDLGRRSIGVELNEEYCEISAKRLQQLSLLGGSE